MCIRDRAIGMGMRGLKAIAEIQYLDYVIYALSPLSDDLSTLRYRTDGMQISAPIIRTPVSYTHLTLPTSDLA